MAESFASSSYVKTRCAPSDSDWSCPRPARRENQRRSASERPSKMAAPRSLMWLLLSSSTDDSGSKHTRWDPKILARATRANFLKGPRSVVVRRVE
jgi:hypothetical protein